MKNGDFPLLCKCLPEGNKKTSHCWPPDKPCLATGRASAESENEDEVGGSTKIFLGFQHKKNGI